MEKLRNRFKMIKLHYSLSEIFDMLENAKYFSAPDLSQDYYQMEQEKQSRAETAFSTENEHFQLKRLAMGLKICPRVKELLYLGLFFFSKKSFDWIPKSVDDVRGFVVFALILHFIWDKGCLWIFLRCFASPEFYILNL